MHSGTISQLCRPLYYGLLRWMTLPLAPDMLALPSSNWTYVRGFNYWIDDSTDDAGWQYGASIDDTLTSTDGKDDVKWSSSYDPRRKVCSLTQSYPSSLGLSSGETREYVIMYVVCGIGFGPPNKATNVVQSIVHAQGFPYSDHLSTATTLLSSPKPA